MIVTIWWEDARQSVRNKLYGPDIFLAACLADDLNCDFSTATRRFQGHPKKGAGVLMRGLGAEAALVLDRGPLTVVFDRDKILDLWPPSEKPSPCKSGICAAIRKKHPGSYHLVLITQNTESLIDAACKAMGVAVPAKSPQKRDDILTRLAFGETASTRRVVRDSVDGFNRLIDWVKKVSA